MKRVMIIGCSGSGKSTLAKRLGEATGLQVIHLDQYYWKPNWVETEKSAWRAIVENLSNKPNWIIDGNYGGTMDIRIEKADTIIYLDYSTFKCLGRITKRILQYRGQVRPDMTTGCKERFDFEFYHYVATFNLTRRKSLLKKLERLKGKKQILIFNSDQASANFLKQL